MSWDISRHNSPHKLPFIRMFQRGLLAGQGDAAQKTIDGDGQTLMRFHDLLNSPAWSCVGLGDGWVVVLRNLEK